MRLARDDEEEEEDRCSQGYKQDWWPRQQRSEVQEGLGVRQLREML